MNLLKMLFGSRKPVLNKPVVSGTLTPFEESIKLLRDLADLQNGAPQKHLPPLLFERHRKEWEETMEQVYDGELPENLEYLLINGNLIEFTKEHRQELIKILEKHDAIRDKLTKLHEDWRKKWGL